VSIPLASFGGLAPFFSARYLRGLHASLARRCDVPLVVWRYFTAGYKVAQQLSATALSIIRVGRLMKLESSAGPTFSPDEQEIMARMGITHSLIDAFHYREYRYSNIEDAVAQAKRDQERSVMQPI
jgi:hypothetical protein